MVLHLPDSWSNWNLEMLVFEGRGKPEYPEEKLRREPTANSTHIWRQCQDFNPGHIVGRRVLSLTATLVPRKKYKGFLSPEGQRKLSIITSGPY